MVDALQAAGHCQLLLSCSLQWVNFSRDGGMGVLTKEVDRDTIFWMILQHLTQVVDQVT